MCVSEYECGVSVSECEYECGVILQSGMQGQEVRT